MGDTNMDNSNSCHKRTKEANDVLSIIKAPNMRRLPTGPTRKSFGLHKVYQCDSKSKKSMNNSNSISTAACVCPKKQKESTIDNAYLSLTEEDIIQVLDDSFSDHFPILITLNNRNVNATNPKTIWQRDLTRLKIATLENALQCKDWSILYDLNNPKEALSLLLKNVSETLDEEAPVRAIKFRPEKPDLSLKRDTLTVISSRYMARKNGNHALYKKLQNQSKSLVKRDTVQSIMYCLKKNSGRKAHGERQ